MRKNITSREIVKFFKKFYSAPAEQPVSACLCHVQPVVSTLLCHQLGMAAGFHNPAVVQHDDGITALHRGKPVGNHQHGPALGYLVQIVHDDAFRLIVKGTGCLVKYHDGRIQYQCPGDADALALSA